MATPAPGIAIDPVCGMKVTIEGARNTTVHDGTTFYFCSPKCLAKFTAEPLRYLKPAEAAPAPPAKQQSSSRRRWRAGIREKTSVSSSR